MLCDSGVHLLDLIEGTQFLPGVLDVGSRRRQGQGRRRGFEELGRLTQTPKGKQPGGLAWGPTKLSSACGTLRAEPVR
jgi:hypothetical protein